MWIAMGFFAVVALFVLTQWPKEKWRQWAAIVLLAYCFGGCLWAAWPR